MMTSPPNPMNTSQISSIVTDEKSQFAVPVQFIPCRDFTTFEAEFAVTEGDLVFHFKVTPEVQALDNPSKYWLEDFSKALDTVAQEVFKASFPRLRAAYTEEMASWYLRAEGAGMLLDPHALAYRFLDALDAALDARMQKP